MTCAATALQLIALETLSLSSLCYAPCAVHCTPGAVHSEANFWKWLAAGWRLSHALSDTRLHHPLPLCLHLDPHRTIDTASAADRRQGEWRKAFVPPPVSLLPEPASHVHNSLVQSDHYWTLISQLQRLHSMLEKSGFGYLPIDTAAAATQPADSVAGLKKAADDAAEATRKLQERAELLAALSSTMQSSHMVNMSA